MAVTSSSGSCSESDSLEEQEAAKEEERWTEVQERQKGTESRQSSYNSNKTCLRPASAVWGDSHRTQQNIHMHISVFDSKLL